MLSSKLSLRGSYDIFTPEFTVAFNFLKRKDLATLPEGWIELEEGVRASVQRYSTFDFDEVAFESHERYYDIQYVIEGMECCAVAKREGLCVKTPYDAENDITFYKDLEMYSTVLLESGDYIILSPFDVHKPRLVAEKKMEIKKIVLKVPV